MLIKVRKLCYKRREDDDAPWERREIPTEDGLVNVDLISIVHPISSPHPEPCVRIRFQPDMYIDVVGTVEQFLKEDNGLA